VTQAGLEVEVVSEAVRQYRQCRFVGSESDPKVHRAPMAWTASGVLLGRVALWQVLADIVHTASEAEAVQVVMLPRDASSLSDRMWSALAQTRLVHQHHS